MMVDQESGVDVEIKSIVHINFSKIETGKTKFTEHGVTIKLTKGEYISDSKLIEESIFNATFGKIEGGIKMIHYLDTNTGLIHEYFE